MKIYEYRGVEGLVYAEVLTDTAAGMTFGTVKPLAGVAEISRATDSANEAHYYDNVPAVVVSSTGSDEVTISTSAIPLDVLAEITGQGYDAQTGMFVEQERESKYFAIGYQTQDTNGNTYFVWRLKGSFNIPDTTNATKDDGTDANGQEITYTGINTLHKFTKTSKSAKAITVNTAENPLDVNTFFSTVQTPDTVESAGTIAVTGVGVAPSAYTLAEGESLQLDVSIYPANATNKNVTFSSSAEGVATVTDEGLIAAVAEGSATITVTTEDGSKTDTCAITVEAAE